MIHGLRFASVDSFLFLPDGMAFPIGNFARLI